MVLNSWFSWVYKQCIFGFLVHSSHPRTRILISCLRYRRGPLLLSTLKSTLDGHHSFCKFFPSLGRIGSHQLLARISCKPTTKYQHFHHTDPLGELRVSGTREFESHRSSADLCSKHFPYRTTLYWNHFLLLLLVVVEFWSQVPILTRFNDRKDPSSWYACDVWARLSLSLYQELSYRYIFSSKFRNQSWRKFERIFCNFQVGARIHGHPNRFVLISGTVKIHLSFAFKLRRHLRCVSFWQLRINS